MEVLFEQLISEIVNYSIDNKKLFMQPLLSLLKGYKDQIYKLKSYIDY